MKWAWVIVLAGGIAEGAWVIFLHLSGNLTKPRFVFLSVVFMMISTGCLLIATRGISAVVAYAVWTGVGGVTAVSVSTWLFGQMLDWRQILCIVVIIGGVVALRLTTGSLQGD